MKKVTIKVTPSMANEIAQFIGENELRTLLSWSQTSGLFADRVDLFVIIAFPEAMTDKVENKLQKYFVTL